ncbi:hypothetical protein F5141DRAFT_1108864 [Pisolithus sp. B1]|nr:hypothetical protein F5141DRAFT_1108864 [Pisolithus sp. B1]
MYHHPHVYLHRPASRILWFLIGAGVATWWNHSPAMRDYHSPYWSCLMWQHRRASLQDQPHGTGSELGPYERDARWGWRPSQTPSVSEAMVDMSESTLESIVSTAEALKAKLAENRARREGALSPVITEQKKDPSPSA